MDWSKPHIRAKYRKLYEQGRAGKAKAAIRCHCLMCVGWEPNEVEQCTATGCPLYTLRNLAAQSRTEAPDREKRRARALARGQRPPKTGFADGHGAQLQGRDSHVADSPGTSASSKPPSGPEGGVVAMVKATAGANPRAES